MPWERAGARIVFPKAGKPFIQHYKPAATTKYEQLVGKRARHRWPGDPSDRPIELQVTVYIEIPESWSKWKREAACRGEILPTGKPDVDNFLKAICDGMTGIVYKDDSQICTIDAVKLYAPEGTEGFVDVQIRENYRCGSWITRLLDLVLLR